MGGVTNDVEGRDNMMTKNRTQFVFIIAVGLSLISGFSQTANIGKSDASSGDNITKVGYSYAVIIGCAAIIGATHPIIAVSPILYAYIIKNTVIIGCVFLIGDAAAAMVDGIIGATDEEANTQRFYQHQRAFSDV